MQSFINTSEDRVVKVCGTAGSRVKGGGNLCISKSEIYDVVSECSVRNVTVRRHKVVLACDKVGKKFLPVHYEIFKSQRAGKENCSNN